MTADETKLTGLLGIAMKAGRIVFGTDRLRDRIRGSGDVYIALIASDASENTVKRVSGCCSYYGTPYAVCTLTSEQLGGCVGKGVCACVGVTDARFYKGVLPLLPDGSVIRPKAEDDEDDYEPDYPPSEGKEAKAPEKAAETSLKPERPERKRSERKPKNFYKPKERESGGQKLNTRTRSDATSGRRAKKA